ncbi:DsrE family protein [Dyella sp. KRB-257]|uniref:DsrE family protein n=1 Tax=Dyella sp. KRB-257 TaxID=3400915 RepID=UPI003C066134
MHKITLSLLLALCAIGAAPAPSRAAPASATQGAPMRVVFHLDTGSKGTVTALHQARNLLTADPTAKIVVVALGESVRFLVKGSKTEGGYPFALMIEDLQQSGVRFEACNNTMTTLKITKNQLDDDIDVVPSGLAEIARLQSREGYAYIKP